MHQNRQTHQFRLADKRHGREHVSHVSTSFSYFLIRSLNNNITKLLLVDRILTVTIAITSHVYLCILNFNTTVMSNYHQTREQ